MPWPLALALAIWGTELIVIVLAALVLLLDDPWDLLPPDRPWTEDDEEEWRELLRQGERHPTDAKGEWR
jgi:hypothetical protein